MVSDDGTPVADLTEDDFDIRVNGKPCPIRTLRFLDLTATERPSIELTPADVSTNAGSMRGRLTVIVLDENSLPEDSRPLMNGLSDYIKNLGPDDRTALVALPRPGVWIDFTNDGGELRGVLLRSSTRATNDIAAPLPLQTTNVDERWHGDVGVRLRGDRSRRDRGRSRFQGAASPIRTATSSTPSTSSRGGSRASKDRRR